MLSWITFCDRSVWGLLSCSLCTGLSWIWSSCLLFGPEAFRICPAGTSITSLTLPMTMASRSWLICSFGVAKQWHRISIWAPFYFCLRLTPPPLRPGCPWCTLGSTPPYLRSRFEADFSHWGCRRRCLTLFAIGLVIIAGLIFYKMAVHFCFAQSISITWRQSPNPLSPGFDYSFWNLDFDR